MHPYVEESRNPGVNNSRVQVFKGRGSGYANNMEFKRQQDRISADRDVNESRSKKENEEPIMQGVKK
jgi:hypothetical protein